MVAGFADAEFAIEVELQRDRGAIGDKEGEIAVFGGVDFINPDHAAIADREADPRAAIDHVAGCEPCARYGYKEEA